MNNTYTLAQRISGKYGLAFSPVPGIPQNLNKQAAEKLAITARVKGFDVVAYNIGAE